VLSISESANRLALADGLGIHTVPNRMLWQGALLRAHQTNIPVYDTLFVELAIREELPLATFDAALQRAFPDVARRPAALPRTSRPL
jgi:predicted nucleic acid-binding protein